MATLAFTRSEIAKRKSAKAALAWANNHLKAYEVCPAVQISRKGDEVVILTPRQAWKRLLRARNAARRRVDSIEGKIAKRILSKMGFDGMVKNIKSVIPSDLDNLSDRAVIPVAKGRNSPDSE